MFPKSDEERQFVLSQVYQLGYEYEQKYGSCPQCTLAALQDVFGADVFETGGDEVFKASYVMGAGGASTTRGTCGALAGAMLAISAKHGRGREMFKQGRKREALVLAKQAYDQFVAEFGSPVCADIQSKLMGRSFDMWDPEDFARFEAAGGHVDKCPNVVGTAARIAAEVLISAQAGPD